MKTAKTKALLLANIGQLVTLRAASGVSSPRRGAQLNKLAIVEDGAVLCVGGKVVSMAATAGP